MSDETLESYLQDFRSLYPTFLKENNVNGFEDEEIKAKILLLEDEAPIKCKYYKKILLLKTLFFLLEDKQRYKDSNNDLTIDITEYKTIVTGDITTTFKESDRLGQFDPILETNRIGIEIKQLLRKCARFVGVVIR